MPTYDYECTHCGHTFEASQKMTERPLSKCPKCSNKLKRLIGSGGGIIFKGSGFYATDYRKKPKEEKGAPSCPGQQKGCKGCDKK